MEKYLTQNTDQGKIEDKFHAIHISTFFYWSRKKEFSALKTLIFNFAKLRNIEPNTTIDEINSLWQLILTQCRKTDFIYTYVNRNNPRPQAICILLSWAWRVSPLPPPIPSPYVLHPIGPPFPAWNLRSSFRRQWCWFRSCSILHWMRSSRWRPSHVSRRYPHAETEKKRMTIQIDELTHINSLYEHLSNRVLTWWYKVLISYQMSLPARWNGKGIADT